MSRFFKNLLFCLILAFVACVVSWYNTAQYYKAEIEHYKSNEKTLLEEVQRYKVSDSLNAAKVGVLSLSVDQYKKYRAEDMQTIDALGVKLKDMQSVNTAQTEMIKSISGEVRDSIVRVTELIHDTLYCIRYEDKWLDINLCLNDNKYFGEIKARDSLLIVSEVKYKRFLGFLWKTKKVKSRDVHIISKNPYTKIMGFEFVELKE